MADGGDTRGLAGGVSGKKACVTFMAMSKQGERNKNWKRLKSKNADSATALGHWRSRNERTMRQQMCQVAKLHHTVDNIAQMLQAQVAYEQMQSPSRKEW